MSLRKEVFQSKVLQRLYPAAPNPEKLLDSAVHPPETFKLSNAIKPKHKKANDNYGVPPSSSRKMYTVLPPPQDFVPPHRDGSATPPHPEPVDNPNEATGGACSDEGHSRKRRKRRKKDASEDAQEKHRGDAQVPEHLTRNKKRKLKKKKHREKLRSLGLGPRPAPLEFTYDHTQEEDEDNAPKVKDVLEFLQSTYDIYTSDRSRPPGSPSVLSVGAAESLFTILSGGTSPPAVLSSLCRLRALLLQKDTVRLHRELLDFRAGSTLTKDEADVIFTLFHYWITELLPLQMEKT